MRALSGASEIDKPLSIEKFTPRSTTLTRMTTTVVSSGFRGLSAIMFGVIPNDDQVKDDQATQVIGKGADFIGFGAKLAEKAFQQVG